MFTRMLRVPLAVTAFAILSLVAGQTVLADTKLGHTGTVGVHSLTDTSSTTGARCNYKFNSSYGLGKLKTIAVRPPNMKAVAGKASQKVGWSFTVQRRFVGATTSAWTNVSTSSVFTATTDDSHNAAFSTESTPVTTSSIEGTDGEHYFRVNVKMIWYRPDNSVQGNAVDRVDFYRGAMNTGQRWTDDGSCGALSPS